MDWMFVPPQNSYVETLIHDIMDFRDGALQDTRSVGTLILDFLTPEL